MEIHKKAGYQGRETMLAEAKNFYGNVTRPFVELFLNFSEEYQLKRDNEQNNCIIAKPIKSTQFNQRWQIDLIDFRTCPDGEFKAAKISCSSKCHGKSEQAKCTNNDASYETEALKNQASAAVMSQSENENEEEEIEKEKEKRKQPTRRNLLRKKK